VGPTMRVLSRWVREFAAGVDAGHAIRLGRPVSADALRDGVVRDAAARPAHPRVPKATAAATVPSRCRSIATSRGRARA
jgi:hypothetical protein